MKMVARSYTEMIKRAHQIVENLIRERPIETMPPTPEIPNDILTSMTDEQLANFKPLTGEEINAALKKGADEAAGRSSDTPEQPEEEAPDVKCSICGASIAPICSHH